MSSHSAECFYLKCEQCESMGCMCLCHRRRSQFYERIKTENLKPSFLKGDKGRGRPRKKENESS